MANPYIRLFLNGEELLTGSRELTVDEHFQSFLNNIQLAASVESTLRLSNCETLIEQGSGLTGSFFGTKFTAYVASKDAPVVVRESILGERQNHWREVPSNHSYDLKLIWDLKDE